MSYTLVVGSLAVDSTTNGYFVPFSSGGLHQPWNTSLSLKLGLPLRPPIVDFCRFLKSAVCLPRVLVLVCLGKDVVIPHGRRRVVDLPIGLHCSPRRSVHSRRGTRLP